MSAAVASPEIECLRRERHRRAWLTAKASVLARGAGYASRLIVIPLSLNVLGPERYGVWLTIGSLIAWLGMTDCGLSRGLVNAIAEAPGQERREDVRRLVSSGFFGFVIASVAIAAIVMLGATWHGVERLLNVGHDPVLARDARALILICGIYFALSFSLRSANSVCEGLQEGYVGRGFDVLSAIMATLGCILLYVTGADLVVFGLVMAAPPLLSQVSLALYIFFFRHPDLRPRILFANVRSLKRVLHFGGPLMLVQLVSLALISVPNILIANRLSPADVPRYAVPYSLFMIAQGFCWFIIEPYVPAFTESFHRGDTDWIRNTWARLLLLTMAVTALAAISIVIAGPWIISWWAGERVVPPRHFLLLMSAYTLIGAWVTTTSILLVGIGAVKLRACLAICAGLVFAPAAWLLLPSLNISAIPVAGIAATSIDAACGLPYALRRLSRACASAQHPCS